MADPDEDTCLFQYEEQRERKYCRFRRPYLVEPAVFLYSIASWTFLTLNDQYLYYRLIKDDSNFANASSLTVSNYATCNVDEENNNVFLDEDATLETALKAEASKWDMYLSLSRLLPCIFTVLIICSYGDRVGRKCGLFLPGIGGTIKALDYIMVDYLNLPVSYLVIGNLLEGSLGYHLTLMASAYAYIADVVPYEKRTTRFAILNSIYLLSCTLSGLMSGYLISGLGYSGTFWIMTTLFALSIVYVVVAVPESLPDDQRRKTLSASEMFWSTINAFRVFTKRRDDPPRARSQLALLLIITIVLSIALLGIIDLETLYLLGPPYCFTSIQIGYFIAFFSLVGVIAPVIIIPLIQMCMTEDVFGIIACVSGVAAYILQGLANNTTEIFMVPIVSVMAQTLVPLTRAMMSKLVSQGEQGSVQASISALNAIGELVSILILVGLYYLTLEVFHGMVFFFVALFYAIMAMLFGVIVYRNKSAAAGREELLKRLGLLETSE